MGDRASELTAEWNSAGDYTDAYYLHGLSVRLGRGAGRVRPAALPRASWAWSPSQGRRYSWGYPACPDTMEHFRLLEALPVRPTRSA